MGTESSSSSFSSGREEGSYGDIASKYLKDVNPGDKIRLKTDNAEYEGFLLPRFDVGNQNTILLKLTTGYNLGISAERVESCSLIESGAITLASPSEKISGSSDDTQHGMELPGISLIGTGGTILSKLDYLTGGVNMSMTPDEIFNLIPELSEIIHFNDVRHLFSIGSEEFFVQHWKELAENIVDCLLKGDDGVVVLHGTDTMSYTAAILSFFLRSLNRPVVITGAQRSSDRGSFDGALNIISSAVVCAKSNIAEVGTVMHSTTSDTNCLFIRGTRVRKMHTSRRDAFRPINDVALGEITVDRRFVQLNSDVKLCSDSEPYADTSFEEKVALVKFYPGCNPEIIDWYIDKKIRGLVIEGTGLGHVAVNTPDLSWKSGLQRAIEEDVFVGMTSQCLYGRTHPFVYRSLRQLSGMEVVYLEDMIPETAYLKLGYVLGKNLEYTETKQMMLSSIAGEISRRSKFSSFLS